MAKRSVAFYRTNAGAKRYAKDLMRVWGMACMLAEPAVVQHPTEFGFTVRVWVNQGGIAKAAYAAPRPRNFGR